MVGISKVFLWKMFTIDRTSGLKWKTNHHVAVQVKVFLVPLQTSRICSLFPTGEFQKLAAQETRPGDP